MAILLETIGSSATVRELEKVSGATKGLGDKATKASGLLNKLGVAGADTGAIMSGALAAGAAAAGAAIFSFGAKSVAAYTDLVGSVVEFQRATGASMEQSSMVIAATDDLGISAESTTKSMFQLTKRITTNAEALAAYGVHAAKDASGNTDMAETLLNVADAYTRTADPAKRAALLTAAFGKSGTDLIPILERGREGIKALYGEAAGAGQIFDAEDRERLLAFNASMDDLHDSLLRFKLVAGEALLPLVKGLADAATGAINLTSKLSSGGGLTDKIGEFLAGGKAGREDPDSFVNTVRQFVDTMVYGTDVAEKNNAAIGKDAEAVDGLADSFTDAGPAVEGLDEKLADLESSLFDVANAQHAVDQANRGLTSAQQNLSDKQATLNELLAKGAVDEKKVAAARKDLADATKELDDATKDLGDAQRILNNATQPATVDQITAAYDRLHGAELDLTDAQEGLSDATDTYNRMLAAFQGGFSLDPASADELAIAQDDVNDSFDDWQEVLKDGKSSVGDIARAHKRYTDALADLDTLQKRGIVTEGQLTDQHEEVERATIGVNTATGNVTSSTQDYYDVLHTGAENDPKVIAAREGVAGATQHVADANQNVIDKQAALGTALAGDPNFKKEVASARQDVADATQHVADASYNVAQQAYAAEQKQKAFNDQLQAGAGFASQLVTQLDELQKKHPELAPLFGPVSALLQQALLSAFPGATPPGQVPRNRVGPAVPALAGGGIVTRPMLAHIGEAGPEAVIPLPRGGGVGGTVYVTVNAGIAGDADRVGNEIYAVLKRLAARNGGLGLN